ncbi:MAG: hypothetical protein H7329_12745 [Opitutaceae bacterium]|nr:hypothetical protein [Cytophagales bacterium]
MKFISLIYFTVFLFVSFFSYSQDFSRWKSHLPNRNCQTIAINGELVFAGGPQTFFSYNTSDNSINYYSKIKGYSGSSITQMIYSEKTAATIIAYENSMIDIVVGKIIIPFYDIFNSNLTGSKAINHLYVSGDFVYISTDFGLVVYNIRKKEVKEVYKNFSITSTTTVVYSSTILNDTIFLATNKGLLVSPVSDQVNKLDYRNWTQLDLSNLNFTDPLQFVASIEDRVYAASKTKLCIYEGGDFINDTLLKNTVIPQKSFYGLKTIDGKLYLLQNNSITVYSSGVYNSISKNANALDIDIDNSNQIWIADNLKGLSKLNGENLESVKTNGPYSNYAFHLYPYLDKMMILTGGYNFEYYGSFFRNNGFSILENGEWQNYNSSLGNVPGALDLSSAVYNSFSNKMYFASYANGILEWNLLTKKFKVMNHYTPGVPLKYTQSFRGDSLGPSSNRVPDLNVDKNGVVWLLNTPDPNIGNASIYKYDLNGKWDSVKFSGNDKWGSYKYSYVSTASYFLHRIFIDRSGNKWLASRYYSLDPSSFVGLFVYNEDKYYLPRYLKYEKDRYSEICGKQVNCIAQDIDGAIWIGTDNGICYFSDPDEVFQLKQVKATIPIINNQPLLKGINVTGIDFDGSNRKWISTNGEGLLLVSSDGTKIINKFNETNSPLINRSVNDVKVIKSTGEVFVATDDGVFSFNGFSILGTDNNQNVIAYPNPIKKEFTGYFTIDGLVNKAIVKVTDMAGNLVYENKAEGSRFTWDVKDYNGHRPQSGVYLIYSSKDDGSEHLLTKIAILD